MKSSVIKRSIDIGGHKTSVSLEDEFWDGLRAIAERQNMTVSALTKRIDNERQNRNLSSAIRVFVFKNSQGQAAATTESARTYVAPVPQHDGIGSQA
jgi:predicted DNA-binding ribbon-helix-helix protein